MAALKPLKNLEGAPGVFYPETWTEEQVFYLRQAYETGLKNGVDNVRRPVMEALGITAAIDEAITLAIENSQY